MVTDFATDLEIKQNVPQTIKILKEKLEADVNGKVQLKKVILIMSNRILGIMTENSFKDFILQKENSDVEENEGDNEKVQKQSHKHKKTRCNMVNFQQINMEFLQKKKAGMSGLQITSSRSICERRSSRRQTQILDKVDPTSPRNLLNPTSPRNKLDPTSPRNKLVANSALSDLKNKMSKGSLNFMSDMVNKLKIESNIREVNIINEKIFYIFQQVLFGFADIKTESKLTKPENVSHLERIRQETRAINWKSFYPI